MNFPSITEKAIGMLLCFALVFFIKGVNYAGASFVIERYYYMYCKYRSPYEHMLKKYMIPAILFALVSDILMYSCWRCLDVFNNNSLINIYHQFITFIAIELIIGSLFYTRVSNKHILSIAFIILIANFFFLNFKVINVVITAIVSSSFFDIFYPKKRYLLGIKTMYLKIGGLLIIASLLGVIFVNLNWTDIVDFIVGAVYGLLLRVFDLASMSRGHRFEFFCYTQKRYVKRKFIIKLLIFSLGYLDPNAPFSIIYRNILKTLLHDYHDSMCEIEAYTSLYDYDISMAINKSALLIETGRYTEALQSLQPYLAKPKTEVFINSGLASLNLGYYDDAIGSFKKALLISPKLEVAYIYITLCLIEKEEYTDAFTWANTVVGMNKALGLSHIVRGQSLHQLGKFEQAKRDFMHVIYNKYGDLEKMIAYECLCEVLVDQGVSYCNQVIELSNDALKIGKSYSLTHNKALALLQLGRYEEAADAFQKAGQLETDSFIDGVNQMAVNFLLGRFSATIKKGEYIVARQPENVDAMQLLANAYLLRGTYDQCESICTRLLELDAKNYIALMVMAGSCFYKGNINLAHGFIVEAEILNNSDWRLYVTRSAIMLSLDNPREAYNAANKAIQMYNLSPEAYLNRAIATTILHGWACAAQDYKQAYTMRKSNVYCLIGIAELYYHLQDYNKSIHYLSLECKMEKDNLCIIWIKIIRTCAYIRLEDGRWIDDARQLIDVNFHFLHNNSKTYIGFLREYFSTIVDACNSCIAVKNKNVLVLQNLQSFFKDSLENLQD